MLILLSNILLPQTAYAWVASGTPLTYTSFATGLKYATQIDFDSSGNAFVSGYKSLPTIGQGVAKYNSAGTLLTSFGVAGSTGVAVDPDGNVLVVDYQNDGMEKYTNTGTPISIAGTDLANQVYSSPYAVTTDSNGNIYVANAGTNQIFKFNSSLAKIATITGNSGAFNFPESVVVDSSDNLYVLDSGNNRVQKFNSSGTWQLTVTGNGIAFNYPEALTVDTNGNIYVADSGNNRIQIFDTTGVFQQEITSANINASLPTFSYLSGMGFGASGTLYVGDNTRVFKINFDHNDPTISITSLTGNTTSDLSPTFTGTATDTTTVITAVQYSIDSGVYSACTADDGLFDELSEAYSCTVSPDLATGSHTIDTRATDSKNNVNIGGTIANYTFTVTSASPSPVASTASSPTPTPTSTNTPPNTHCSALPPDSAPNIFKIARVGTEVNIYFSPLSSNVTSYQLMYGYTPQDERFSATFGATLVSGALKYTVGELTESQTYSFWMRGMNDCSPGPWSNTYTSYGLRVTSTASPSPSPTASDNPSTPDIALTTTETNTETSEVTVQITIVDPLGMPLSETPVSLTPSSTEAPDNGASVSAITDKRGVVTFTTKPGEYTITAKFNNVSYSQGLILSANTSFLKVVIPIPLRDSIERQIFAPVDASYVVKAGVGLTLLDAIVGSLVGILAISGIIFSTLTTVYMASSRSFIRMPIDYLSSLTQFITLGLSSKLAPLIPSIRNKRKSNGLVFNAYSFKPIPKAYVVLFSSSGNLKTDFTDINGRYNFEGITPDDYQMRTEAPGYIFPSQLITTSTTETIPHVYQPGEVLPVSQDVSILKEVAVPMDPKMKLSLFKKLGYSSTAVIRKLTTPAHILNIGIISAAVLTNPTQFNQLIAIIYGAYLLVKVSYSKHLKRMSGLLLDGSRLPITDAVIRLYKTSPSGERGTLYTTTKTDKSGRYYIQPEIGNYTLEATTPGGIKIVQTVRIMKNVPTVDRTIIVEG